MEGRSSKDMQNEGNEWKGYCYNEDEFLFRYLEVSWQLSSKV